MRSSTFYGLALLLLTFVSCEKDPTNSSDKESDIIIQEENQDGRIKTDSAGVVSSLKLTNLKSVSVDDEMASDLPLVLVAEVTPPKYKGQTLRATHVALSTNYAYVSYNYEGDTYLGGIDVIDISDPDNPQMMGTAILPDTDLSSIAYSSGSIIVVGAKSTLHDDESNPACAIRINLASNLLSEDALILDLPGYVGTDIAVSDDAYFPVSGDNGAINGYKLLDNERIETFGVADLRAVGIDNSQVVALSGYSGINIYNPVDLSYVSGFATSVDVPGKRTIDFYNGNVLVAEGYNGVGIYNLSTGDKVVSIPLAAVPDSEEIDPDEVVCNAVSVNNEHIFVANGAAGVSVLSINESAIDNLDDFGSLDLPGSANYVMSKGEYVFVADGTGGLQILKMVTVDPETELTCSDYPEYDGKKNLTVSTGEDLGYSGSASLDKIELNSESSLFWCGSLGVSQHIIINDQAELTIKGSLAQGDKNQDFTINSGGTLNVEGSVVIYGDLQLNSSSTINFLGENSSITIHGDVTNNGNVTITGTFTDTEGKLSN